MLQRNELYPGTGKQDGADTFTGTWCVPCMRQTGLTGRGQAGPHLGPSVPQEVRPARPMETSHGDQPWRSILTTSDSFCLKGGSDEMLHALYHYQPLSSAVESKKRKFDGLGEYVHGDS